MNIYLLETQVENFDLHSYNKYVCAFSGGKDSMALVLYLLLHGVSPDKIELHHHEIDGREGSTLMDWNVTSAYVQAFGDAFGIPVYYSWKEGGFEREMTRENALTSKIIAYEKAFGKTIKRKESIEELISKGDPYETITQELTDMANSDVYLPKIIMSSDEQWILPAGAYGQSCGPV